MIESERKEFESVKKEVQELKATVNFLIGFVNGVREVLNDNDIKR